MSSYNEGKDIVVQWIRKNFPAGSSCLDVGACDGKWSVLLGQHLIIDAVEIYEPNIITHRLHDKYRAVICGDIADYSYDWYDLIIFGDVIEHMSVEKAQRVLQYAEQHCHDMIVSVPFLYKQTAIYGNRWEEHIQDDLTEELFFERYGKWEKLVQPKKDYCYFHKPPQKTEKVSPL